MSRIRFTTTLFPASTTVSSLKGLIFSGHELFNRHSLDLSASNRHGIYCLRRMFGISRAKRCGHEGSIHCHRNEGRPSQSIPEIRHGRPTATTEARLNEEQMEYEHVVDLIRRLVRMS